jgi:hypothetical protein
MLQHHENEKNDAVGNSDIDKRKMSDLQKDRAWDQDKNTEQDVFQPVKSQPGKSVELWIQVMHFVVLPQDSTSVHRSMKPVIEKVDRNCPYESSAQQTKNSLGTGESQIN